MSSEKIRTIKPDDVKKKKVEELRTNLVKSSKFKPQFLMSGPPQTASLASSLSPVPTSVNPVKSSQPESKTTTISSSSVVTIEHLTAAKTTCDTHLKNSIHTKDHQESRLTNGQTGNPSAPKVNGTSTHHLTSPHVPPTAPVKTEHSTPLQISADHLSRTQEADIAVQVSQIESPPKDGTIAVSTIQSSPTKTSRKKPKMCNVRIQCKVDQFLASQLPKMRKELSLSLKIPRSPLPGKT